MKARANIGLSIVKARLLGARLLRLTSTVLLLVVSSQATGFAGSATWKANPTSGNGTFTNSGGVARGGDGGGTIFLNGATADNGTFTIDGGAVSGAHGGR